MKNSKQIRESIGEVQTRLTNLETLIKSENRDFTEDEQTTYDSDMEEVERLLSDLDKVEKQEQIRLKAASLAGVKVEKPEERELDKMSKDFSFGKAVRAVYGIPLEGVERELSQEGDAEMKAIGKASRGVVIPSSVLSRAVITENGTTGVQERSFVEAVYANTILSDLGITRIDGVVDQRIPILGAVSTQWETEVSDAADGGAATTKKDLTPRRLAAFVDYSKQSAMQTSNSLEQALRNNIAQAVGAKVEYAVFTDDSANGAFNYLGNGKTALTNADITQLVLAVKEEVLGNNHDRGSLGFAISSSLFSDVYSAAQVSGVNPLIVNEMIMGITAKFSTQIAQIATNDVIYYGDWSKFMMAQFGGVEILLDPYTQATKGTDRLVLNSYWDAALMQDAAISVGGKV